MPIIEQFCRAYWRGTVSMSTNGIDIIIAEWSLYQKTLIKLRKTVFILEQGVPIDLEQDNLDHDLIHFLVRDGRHAIGCARLHKNGKISRMAVLDHIRSEGIGTLLLNFIHDYATQNNFRELHLNAQKHALRFYEKAGYKTDGAVFFEAGIRHIPMRISVIAVGPGP